MVKEKFSNFENYEKSSPAAKDKRQKKKMADVFMVGYWIGKGPFTNYVTHFSLFPDHLLTYGNILAIILIRPTILE